MIERNDVKHWLHLTGTTQHELAQRIGVTDSALSMWLSGKMKEFSAPVLRKLEKEVRQP